ncbi:hypothetical protein GCM10009641_02000 [Mycobacterium cookii]|uniref:Uncharacterized protein n=1 Tax=Mycobacterium cookii TaxID=1775 RepID=A0A7I7L3U0_9MYCO|nr:hypothetical protein [Mycobacterium cookii]MCV7329414.1 hypothetical protein [Mycobacterium cookii]BBX48754.1 hypothetical protein MCOO_47690 [Mycobacterium cookii]
MLQELGFALDEIDDDFDEGGRPGSVVYYRSRDCKVQVYKSSREASVNCMMAPLSAANIFGLYDESNEWQYLRGFCPAPDLPLEELVKSISYKSKSDREQLAEVRESLSDWYEAARAGILRTGNSQ